MLSLKLRVGNFFLIVLLDKGLKNFYTKFQVNIFKHSVAITEKQDRQSSLLHPVDISHPKKNWNWLWKKSNVSGFFNFANKGSNIGWLCVSVTRWLELQKKFFSFTNGFFLLCQKQEFLYSQIESRVQSQYWLNEYDFSESEY